MGDSLITRSPKEGMTGNDCESRSATRRKSAVSLGENGKMASQSQGIKQLMAAEKEAAQVVANARKGEL